MIAPLLCLFALAAPANLLVNTDFSGALDGWINEASIAAPRVELRDDSNCLVLEVSPENAGGWPRVNQRFEAIPGTLYEAAAEILDEGMAAGYGAYMTIEFLDADGKRLQFEQSAPGMRGLGWAPVRARAVAPPEARAGLLCLVLHGHGRGAFRAPALRVLAPPAPEAPASATLTVDAAPLPRPLLGIGFEDDGWLASPHNAEHGVTEEDIALCMDRAAWLSPDLVRMFFWYQDWNPSGDWSTFDFDSPGMKSHYRALDAYQAIGAQVVLCGVEWGVKNPFAQPDALAHAVGALVEHLVRVRGYTCIRYWTLSNEPNTFFLQRHGTFDEYAAIHALVRAEFNRRGLSVGVTASDDTSDGLAWFKACLDSPQIGAPAPLYSSHFYLKAGAIDTAAYLVRDRTALLAGRAPFIVGEFGFQDARSGTLENPLMDEWPYALWAGTFALDSLAQGAVGVVLWCLHETYYPNGWFMNYGLWKYKTHAWQPRPVFYAWANLTRNSQAGDAIHAVTNTAPQALSALRVGDALFWVNRGSAAISVQVAGMPLAEVRHLVEAATAAVDPSDEAALRALADGLPLPLADNTFLAPPHSFGRAW